MGQFVAAYNNFPELAQFQGSLADAKTYFVSLLDSRNSSEIEIFTLGSFPVSPIVSKYTQGIWCDI